MKILYKIVLVDDERLTIKSFAKVIEWEKFGFELAGVFFNAFDCIEYIENNDVDVVISDISMPQMDGIEMVKKINLIKPDIKIILASAYKKFDYAIEAVKLKVSDYIIKPYDCKAIEDVLTAVSKELSPIMQNKDETEEVYDAIKRSKQYIRTHLEYGPSLAEVAEHVSFSPAYFGRVFKERTGEKFLDYVNRTRIEEACNYLVTSGMKVNEIYEKVGYKSRNYFYNMFKSIMGCTPQEYREKIRKDKEM